MEYAVVFFGALIADFAGAVIGFGGATVLTPIVLMVFDFKTALPLVAVSHILSNLARVRVYRDVDWKLAAAFIVPGMLASVFGAALAVRLPQQVFLGIFGGFLSVFALVAWVRPSVQAPRGGKSAVVGGLLYGLTAGLVGTAGAVRSAFLTTYTMSKEAYIATSAMIAIAADAARLPVYLSAGADAGTIGRNLPGLVVAAVAGTILGKKLVQSLSAKAFRGIILAALFAFGIGFVYRGIVSP